MGDITIRGIDDAVLRELEQRASAAGRSLEEEARGVLERTVGTRHQDFWEQADRLRASFGGRVVSDSGEIARDMREERSNRIGEP